MSACIVGAGRARDAFRFSRSSQTDGGQYGTVVRVVVTGDGARSETEHEYDDLCAEVRAESYGPADLSGCDDVACVEDRFQGAQRVRRCGPEEECGTDVPDFGFSFDRDRVSISITLETDAAGLVDADSYTLLVRRDDVVVADEAGMLEVVESRPDGPGYDPLCRRGVQETGHRQARTRW